VGPSGYRPFRSPVPHELHHAPFPPPPHRTGRAPLTHPALRRGSPPSTRLSFARRHSPFRNLRTLNGVVRQHGQSPGSWSLPERPRSQAPSLHRHYPASPVLWACPTPQAARPGPRGLPVAPWGHRLGSPVLRRLSLCKHAVAITPVGPQPSGCSPGAATAAFPLPLRGRLPH